MKKVLLLFVLILSCADSPDTKSKAVLEKAPVNRFTVTVSDDTLFIAPRWAKRIEVADPKDTVNWEVMGIGEPDRFYLRMRTHKSTIRDFEKQRPYHKEALKKIFEIQGMLDTIHYASAGFEVYSNSWSVPVAIAASQHEDYQDYRANYPNSRITGVNFLFVELANETQAYAPLGTLFRDFGYEITMTGCEKVFGGKVKELPFKEELLKAGLSENESVIYDAGWVDFVAAKIK